jgi:hypothetical protein
MTHRYFDGGIHPSKEDPVSEVSGEYARWSVQSATWAELPDDVAALVAPPVIVSAELVGPRYDNTNAAAYGVRGAVPEQTPRFLIPAPPLPQRNRTPRIA